MLQAAARAKRPGGGNFGRNNNLSPSHQRAGGGGYPLIREDNRKPSYLPQNRVVERVIGSANKIPNLSVLHYGPKCELYKYERDLEEYARLHYGDLAQMFTLDAYYVPDPIEIGEFGNGEDDASDMNEIDIVMYTEERKLRLKEIVEMRKNRPKLFGAMWIQLSEESRNRIMDLQNYKTEIKKGDDPLKLWLAIKETHMTEGASTPALNQYHALEAYQKLRMVYPETLAIFLEKFSAAIKTITATGGTAPDDASQAVAFVMKLDDRFTQLQETLKNNDSLGVQRFPETLSSAHHAASKFLVSNPRLQGRFHNGRRYRSSYAEAVFLTSEDLPVAGGGGGHHQSSKKDKRSIECFKCGKMGHYANECRSNDDGTKNRSAAGGKLKKFRVQKPAGPHRKSPSYHQKKPSSASDRDLVMYSVQSSDEEDDFDEADDDAEEEFAFALSETIFPLLPFQKGEEMCLYSSNHDEALADFRVHLDNQASRSLIRNPNLCENVRHTGDPISFTGVGGTATTDMVGEMPLLGTVCILTASPVNILALHEIEDRFDVIYQPGVSFYFYLENGRKIEFRRNKKGLYVCDMSWIFDERSREEAYVATVADNEKRFTKDQVERAKLARELMITMGCTSAANLIRLTRGILLNCPVSAEDVYRATKIYGPLLGAIKGKTKIRRAGKVIVEDIPRPVDANLTLHTDIMFIEGVPFLVSVAMPMGLCICSHLNSRSEPIVRAAFNNQVKQLRARHFLVVRVLVDGEGALFAMRFDLQAAGIMVDPAGPNQHVPAVEVRIKVLKQIFRSVYTSLPYKLPKFLFKYLVYFAASRVNMYPVSSRPDPTPARELFTGRKIDFKKDIRIGFGEYCQVEAFPIPRNSATKPRTKGAISLDPKGNLQGTIRFFVLGSERKRATVVSRDTWTKMPITDDLIHYINRISDEAETAIDPRVYEVHEGDNDGIVDQQAADAADAIEEPTTAANVEQEVQAATDEAAVEAGVAIEIPTVDPAHQVPLPVDEVEDVIPVVTPEEDPPGWNSSDVVKSNHQVFTTLSYRKGLKKHGKSAQEAAAKEMKQMLEKDVWEPIAWKDLDASEKPKKVIRSFMFLKEKFGPNGEFQKLKMRLVAGGHMQDKLDVDLVSSPTVALSTVFILFAYAARHGFNIVTIDITGAYLNASMVNSDVWMSIDKELVDALLLVEPSYEKFRRNDGSLVVRLKKALYGCVESAKLWYDHLSRVLMKFGLIPSKYDECMFSMSEDGATDEESRRDLFVAVYVDDLLICGRRKTLVDKLKVFLREEFETITVNDGDEQAYIGMNFAVDRENYLVRTSMHRYVQEVLAAGSDAKGCARTPATSDLFVVDEDSDRASEKESVAFHSSVAKLLYLAKRVRPDLLTAISFLATRVRNPTKQDLEKLSRVVRYIRGTANYGIELKMSDGVLDAYIDASHCLHSSDGKSQTGLFVTVGSGPFFVRSAKQKLVAKSSTEAELVAISDSLPALVWMRELLIEQRMIERSVPVTVHEDNQSTIALVRRGKPSGESSRHINIRHFFVTDRCRSNEVKMIYVPTEEQVADYLTKPLVGQTFHYLRDQFVCPILSVSEDKSSPPIKGSSP